MTIERRTVTDRAQWPICAVDGCEQPTRRRRCLWCAKHYDRQRRNGNSLVLKKTEFGKALQYFRGVVLNYDGDDCLIWPFGCNGNGYAEVRLNGRHRLIHNLVCEHVHGPRPTFFHEAAHGCGNGHKGCVAKQHLRWATTKENAADRILHGTHLTGEQHPRTKLTDADIKKIRLDQRSLAIISSEYGISREYACLIRTGKAARHVN